MLKRIIIKSLGFIMAMTLATVPYTSHAAEQPTRIVVGFAPGGAADILARTFAQWLHEHLGETYIVENRPGASAQIAVDHTRRSTPNGKTILITSPSPIIVFPLTYKKLGYDPDKDLIPVAHLVDAPQAFAVNATSPIKSMKEYLASVKKNPNAGAVGMVTLGSPTHFGLLTLGHAIDTPLMPVSYKGVAPMLSDVIGGVLPASINPLAGQTELYKAGKIRFLAVTGTHRSKLLPDLPTMKEAGADGFDMASGWFAAFVPAGTPKETVDKLEKAFMAAAKDPVIREKLGDIGLETTGWSGNQLRQFIQTQRDYWKPIISASGFTADS
ncbi:ABC transporter substrate-binding protein [Advenella sp. S44]|uniref:Bug family tripartite tricarboxylate transporter substrate binding protein n=1 Tax=Advenella sp. S44 TaxID=1982755 RepID=UPI000C2A0050|nr:Bug family tripartite tricarboxylate transporter substrate binding protein [Advenella sp. S44]PJX23408.1 ABC transporter substrate-binding protein [Advenella sp. S44]